MENFVFCVMNYFLCGMFDTDAFVLFQWISDAAKIGI